MDLASTRAAVDEALAEWLVDALDDAGEIAGPIRHAVLAPGKRIRPLLLVAAWEAAGGGGTRSDGSATGPGGRPTAICRLACGPELVHAYSLIHDDLPCMDDDDLRRGRPAVHVKYGLRAAILAGAALMPMAIRAVGAGAEELGLGDDVAARLILSLAMASGGSGMVGGQLLDLRAEGATVDTEGLERIHVGKTARLIAACCTMGGLAAGASPDTIARLTRHGEAIGLAFQTVDDILDVTGSPRQMGKLRGRDQALGKATTPSVMGLSGARARAEELGRLALAEIDPLPAAEGLREIARHVLERDR